MAFHIDIPGSLTLVTDREKLSLILSNLFSNAVAYGSPSSPVTCSAASEGLAGGGLVLRVGNFTEALVPGDVPKIFDRFWRKDPARSGGKHHGLGLSLVSALCDLLHLTKEARLSEGYFEISLLGPIGRT
jgi:signal transduction histidine kinase